MLFANLGQLGHWVPTTTPVPPAPLTFDEKVTSFGPSLVSYWTFKVTGADAQGVQNASITGLPETSVETIVLGDTLAEGASADGKCIAWHGSTTEFAQAAHNVLHKTAAGTAIVYFQRDTAADDTTLIVADDGVPPGGLFTTVRADGSHEARLRTAAGGAGTQVILAGAAGSVELDQAYAFSFRWGAAGISLALFDDTGALVGPRLTSATPTTGMVGNTSAMRFGLTHNGTNPHDGPFGRVVWLNRYVSDAEEALLCGQARTIDHEDAVVGDIPTNANCYPATGSASTVSVSTTAALQTAINGAVAGRHILLAAGTYAGAVTIGASAGTVAQPVVIRPSGAIGSPVATGFWTFSDTSQRVVVVGVDFNGGHVTMRGDHNRVDLCEFRTWTGNAVNFDSSRDGRISRCDFHNPVTNTNAPLRVFAGQENNIASGQNTRNRIDHCYVHAFITVAPAPNGQEAFSISNNDANTFLDSDEVDVMTFDRCLFTGYNAAGDNEMISIKFGGATIKYCTFTDCAGWVNQRQCCNNKVISCWFEDHTANGNDGAAAFGDNHLFAGNRFVRSDLRIRGGDTSYAVPQGSTPSPEFCAARQCKIVDNVFDACYVQIGPDEDFGPTGPVNTTGHTLWGNTRVQGGAAHILGPLAGAGITTTTNPGLGPYDAAVKLTTAQVGLSATDPYCPI